MYGIVKNCLKQVVGRKTRSKSIDRSTDLFIAGKRTRVWIIARGNLNLITRYASLKHVRGKIYKAIIIGTYDIENNLRNIAYYGRDCNLGSSQKYLPKAPRVRQIR